MTSLPHRLTSRRTFLRTLCALPAGAVILAACGMPAAGSATATPAAPATPPGTVPAATVPAPTPTAAAPATPAPAAAAPPTTGLTTSQPAVAAATALLAALDDTQRTAVSFAFDDDEQRVRWSNFPTGIFQRAGMRLGDLSQAQRDAVYAVLAATLSAQGYQQTLETVAADEVLKSTDGGGRLVFSQDEYWFSLLGTPSDSDPWMWQFGGHHLALNATFGNGDLTLAPSLTGAQPAIYMQNGVEVRPLGAENDAAFVLINLLDASQQQQAIIGSETLDLVLGPGQDGVVLQPEGLVAAELSAEQQAALLTLIRTRVGIVNDTAAAKRMAEIAANLAETSFAWSGPTTDGSAAYFRIQGPTVVIEYAPQQMGGSAINHIHAMYRDPTNEYGLKLVG